MKKSFNIISTITATVTGIGRWFVFADNKEDIIASGGFS